jgi:hypothetical protein
MRHELEFHETPHGLPEDFVVGREQSALDVGWIRHGRVTCQ